MGRLGVRTALASCCAVLACTATATVTGPAPAPGGEPVAVAAAAEGGRASGEMAALLSAHNRFRASHCAAPLRWSARLATFAQAWADRLARKGCRLEHRTRSSYGENLAAGSSSIMGAEDAARGWYREVRGYRFARGGFSMSTGHFTQMVWLGSQRLGCGTSRCGDIRLWVCNYDPPGNFEGQFRQNVLPTSCRR
jgi:pathogenesis-related protein 1